MSEWYKFNGFYCGVSNRFIFTVHGVRMIDWQRISELERDVGADELPELIAVFLSEVGGAISALGQPTEEEMHFLRGSAATLGFAELATLAGQGEDALKRDRSAAVNCAMIKSAYTSEKSELLTRFPKVE